MPHQGRFDMIHNTCTGDHSCRDVLVFLKRGHRGTRQTSNRGSVHVQARCNEGMDNFLARVAVEESLDLFNVYHGSRQTETMRLWGGGHGHACVKDSIQYPDCCNRDDQRLAKSPTWQGDLR